MENRSYDAVLGSANDAPRLSSYARACGLATNYRAITHPSLPNYLAATSGSTGGVTSDCSPTECAQNRPSLFGQLDAAGLQWRTYAEGMPSACNLVSQGSYATKHNPAVYFTPVRARCRSWDLPMSGTGGPFATALHDGTLPAFAFVEPDICDDGHDCSTAHADAWLGATLDRVTRSPSYRAGDVAVFVTWDEGVGDDQHIATVVVAPGVTRGARSAVAFSHYSLLRTTEALLRLPLLGAARTASDMRTAFGLNGQPSP
jgi:phospholipase C